HGHDGLKSNRHLTVPACDDNGIHTGWRRIEGFCQRTATLVARGHELGCHTFAHCHSWDTKTKEFERSILEKRIVRIKAVPADRVYERASAMARNGGTL